MPLSGSRLWANANADLPGGIDGDPDTESLGEIPPLRTDLQADYLESAGSGTGGPAAAGEKTASTVQVTPNHSATLSPSNTQVRTPLEAIEAAR